jgi:hypothetical protein
VICRSGGAVIQIDHGEARPSVRAVITPRERNLGDVAARFLAAFERQKLAHLRLLESRHRASAPLRAPAWGELRESDAQSISI